VAIGLAMRLFQYLVNRSLWLDEAVLANLIVGRGVRELLLPGSTGPIAPGFLLVSKATTLAGTSEYVLRILPLAAGMGALGLFVVVARRHLGAVSAVVAVALFAASPFLIYYTSEFKQYSTDAAITVLILFATPSLLGSPITLRRALLLGVAGIAVVFFSFPCIFVLGAVTLTRAVVAARQRDWHAVYLLMAVGVFWAIAFGVPYLLLLRRIADSGYLPGYLQGFWEEGFIPVPPRNLADLLWLPAALGRIFRDPLGPMDFRGDLLDRLHVWGGMAAAVAGVVSLWLRRRSLLAVVLLTLALALLGSALRVYPFGDSRPTGGRVLVFLAPLFILLMAEGVGRLLTSRWWSSRAVGGALLLTVLVPPLAEAMQKVPYGRTEIKSLLAYIQEHKQAGDVVFVNYDIKAPFQFYRERFGFHRKEYMLGTCSRRRPVEYLNQLDALRGHGRVWVLFANEAGIIGFPERLMMTDYLKHIGTPLEARVAVGAELYLFDLSASRPRGSFANRLPEFAASEVDNCAFFDATL
jgi:hypothetical protein